MKGYVAVFAHPYFAITGSEGTFELRSLPSGTYTLTAWHECLGTSNQTVTVRSGESRTVEFTLTANND